MNEACMSNCKDPENRSNKDCCCGGHSAKDVKKNLHHHSTYKKYLYRLSKLFKKDQQDNYLY